MKSFLAWADRRNFISVRSFVMYVTVWMTWESFMWAASFASTTAKSGPEVSLVIGSVTAPIALLQAAVFKVYADSTGAPK